MSFFNLATRQQILVFVLVCATMNLPAQTSVAPVFNFEGDNDPSLFEPQDTLTNELILKRLKATSGNCITPRVTSSVRSYINQYLKYNTNRSKNMLGRRLTYFPIFEKTLKEHGLPTDLKYLAVVESALIPDATSRVGAKGLWQFMPVTGKEFDLRQSSTVDERCDAVRSTEAAAKYLKMLYKMYDDWALALAAYNSGPGRVNYAIKRGRSRNFWAIYKYLPKETRNYVPAFIGAAYVCNFYQIHGLDANIPDFDEQLTESILVYEAITFKDIAEATGLKAETVQNLNASYKKQYLPASERGNYVLLPQRVIHPFINYLNKLGGKSKYHLDESIRFMGGDHGNGRYAHFTVTASESGHIDLLAGRYGCIGEQLCAWNLLNSPYIKAGEKLRIWRPVHVLKHNGERIEAPALAIVERKPSTPASDKKAAETNEKTGTEIRKPVWHTVQRTETLRDIARRYRVDESHIRSLNKFHTLKVGMRLKVSEG